MCKNNNLSKKTNIGIKASLWHFPIFTRRWHKTTVKPKTSSWNPVNPVSRTGRLLNSQRHLVDKLGTKYPGDPLHWSHWLRTFSCKHQVIDQTDSVWFCLSIDIIYQHCVVADEHSDRQNYRVSQLIQGLWVNKPQHTMRWLPTSKKTPVCSEQIKGLVAFIVLGVESYPNQWIILSKEINKL